MTRVRIVCCCIAATLSGGLFAKPDAPTPSAEIENLVRKLGDAAFPVREQATRRLTELGEQALPALRVAMKDPDPEIRRRADAIVRALTYLSPEARAAITAAAIKAFAAADYETAARQQARLARLPRPTIDECIAVGHDWQLAGKWADAVTGYLRAVERIDEILNGDPEHEPLPMPLRVPGPQNGPNGIRGIQELTEHQRRELARRRAGLLLLAGRIQRDQAGDPAAAAVTFARIVDSVPEFKGDLPTLLDALLADVRRRRARQEVPRDIGRGLQLINEFDLLEELAVTQQRLGRPDDAILTLARLNATRIRSRDDGIDESLAQMTRLIQQSAAVQKLPAAMALATLTPAPAPVEAKPRQPHTRPTKNADTPFEWVATNLGDFKLGSIAVRDQARLPDGRWVATLTIGQRVYVATSRDLQTWDAPLPVPASIIGNNIDPAITVDNRGVVWLAWFSNRLSLDTRGSAGYTLWLAHSSDLKTWSPPRAIPANTDSGWPLGAMHWLRVGDDFRLSWRTAMATAASPAQITGLSPISLPQDRNLWFLDPHVTRDPAGQFHMVAHDMSRGVVYATSADGKSWSEAVLVVGKEPNSSGGGQPHLFVDGPRVALIYQDRYDTVLRRGTLADLHSAKLSPPVALGAAEASPAGCRWQRVDDQIVGFTGGESPWLLRAKVADVFGSR
jgi:hypothetical protein